MIRENISLLKLIIIATLIALALIYISGCGKADIQKLQSEKEALKSENEALKGKIASLEQEILKLKETAEFHYQQGIDLLKDSKYEEAKAAFEAVIEKYPASSLVSSAKQRLETVNREIKKLEAEKLAEEKRRIEEQQYQPKSEEEAIVEWDNFRREPDKYKGTVTTWRLRVRWAFDNLDCDFGKNVQGHEVKVAGSDKGTDKYFTYKELSLLGKVPKVSKDDWILLTGKFMGVSDMGHIVLSTIRVKNEGYQ